jgi:hypothetical protein
MCKTMLHQILKTSRNDSIDDVEELLRSYPEAAKVENNY